MRTTLCLAIVFTGISSALANQPQPPSTPLVLTSEQAARLSVHTPLPEYPPAARQRHLTGSGMFRLHVWLQTGLVRSLQIERSTGSAILDGAATGTLRQWRFKPEALRKYHDSHNPPGELIVRVPVIFVFQ